jgi:PAS domain-containing protein
VDIGKYWKTIFDTLQDGLMVFDVEGNILAANPAAVRLTGYSANELIGSNCRILNCTGCELYGRGSGKKLYRLRALRPWLGQRLVQPV